jgi:hypothetical protein
VAYLSYRSCIRFGERAAWPVVAEPLQLPGCGAANPPIVSEHSAGLESQSLIRTRFFILIPVIRAHFVGSIDRLTGRPT